MRTRYHTVAIALHWVMALAFFGMLGSGMIMTDTIDDKALQFSVYQWHKSLGVLLLLAFFARLGVRLLTVQPPLPADMKPIEQKLAKLGHFALYALMLLVPLAGWLTVSSSEYGLPTIVFGWFEWPHIPGVAANEAINEFAEEAHGFLAYAFLALIVLHVAAVVKHALVDKKNLLPRMGIGKGRGI